MTPKLWLLSFHLQHRVCVGAQTHALHALLFCENGGNKLLERDGRRPPSKKLRYSYVAGDVVGPALAVCVLTAAMSTIKFPLINAKLP